MYDRSFVVIDCVGFQLHEQKKCLTDKHVLFFGQKMIKYDQLSLLERQTYGQH